MWQPIRVKAEPGTGTSSLEPAAASGPAAAAAAVSASAGPAAVPADSAAGNSAAPAGPAVAPAAPSSSSSSSLASSSSSSSSLLNSVADEFKCGKCGEPFAEENATEVAPSQSRLPRSLPCTHTFCTRCLVQMLLEHQQAPAGATGASDVAAVPTGRVRCPTCKDESNVRVPDGASAAASPQSAEDWARLIPVNQLLLRMMAQLHKMAQQQHKLQQSLLPAHVQQEPWRTHALSPSSISSASVSTVSQHSGGSVQSSGGLAVTAPPAAIPYLTPEGETFYVTLLQMEERGRLVPITLIAIMDPGFPIPPQVTVIIQPASSAMGRGPQLLQSMLDKYWMVDAFLHTPTPATGLIPPEQYRKFAKEYVKFFQYLGRSSGSGPEQLAKVVLPAVTFFLKGPEPGTPFDESVPVRLFFDATKVAPGGLTRSISVVPPMQRPDIMQWLPMPPPPQPLTQPQLLPPLPPQPPPQPTQPTLTQQMHALLGSVPPPAVPAPAVAIHPPVPAAAVVPAAAAGAAVASAPAAAATAPSSSASVSQASQQSLSVPAPVPDSTTQSMQVSPEFLSDLTHAHDWPLGAVAELVHNSQDAGARHCRISVERLGPQKMPHFIVEDDGSGMTNAELRGALSFGRIAGRVRGANTIGRYGFGLKSGGMRLGADLLVLTKTSTTWSIGFLSQTFNKAQKTARAPIITRLTNHSLDTSVNTEAQVVEAEEIIKRYTCFDHFALGVALNKMPKTGTRIIIFNLTKDHAASEAQQAAAAANGDDDDDDDDDVSMSAELKAKRRAHKAKQRELAAARLALQNKHSNLVGPLSDAGYELKFTRVPGDIQIEIDPVSNMKERPAQMSTDVPCDYSLRAFLELLFLVEREEQKQSAMEITLQGQKVEPRVWRSFLDTPLDYPCPLKKFTGRTLLLGFNEVEQRRGNAGIMLYWHGTLIESYRRVGLQAKGNSDAGLGVIGVLDVGDGLAPANNKLSFPQSSKAFKHLLAWLDKVLDEYVHGVLGRDLIETQEGEVERLRRAGRIESTSAMVCCDRCAQWRRVSQRTVDIVNGSILADGRPGDGVEKRWYCYQNEDKRFASCDVPQEKNIDSKELVISTNRGATNKAAKSPEAAAAAAAVAKPKPRALGAGNGSGSIASLSAGAASSSKAANAKPTPQPKPRSRGMEAQLRIERAMEGNDDEDEDDDDDESMDDEPLVPSPSAVAAAKAAAAKKTPAAAAPSSRSVTPTVATEPAAPQPSRVAIPLNRVSSSSSGSSNTASATSGTGSSSSGTKRKEPPLSTPSTQTAGATATMSVAPTTSAAAAPAAKKARLDGGGGAGKKPAVLPSDSSSSSSSDDSSSESGSESESASDEEEEEEDASAMDDGTGAAEEGSSSSAAEDSDTPLVSSSSAAAAAARTAGSVGHPLKAKGTAAGSTAEQRRQRAEQAAIRKATTALKTK